MAIGPFDCPRTDFTTDRPPDAHTASFTPTWYVNPEHTMWAGLAPDYLGKWYGETDHKVLWWRRGPLEVKGDHLNLPAMSLKATIPSGYPSVGFQASGIYVPVAGCWRIVARTPMDVLTFIIYAYPRDYAGSTKNSASLNDLVLNSDAIILGKTKRSQAFEGAFWRQTLGVSHVWKGNIASGADVDILQDQNPIGMAGEPTLRIGHEYLLFLEQRRFGLWRIIGGGSLIAEVKAGRLQSMRFLPGALFWQPHRQSLMEIDTMLRRLGCRPLYF